MRRSAHVCALLAGVAVVQPCYADARTRGESRRLDNGFFSSSFHMEAPQEVTVTSAPTAMNELMSPFQKMTMSEASQQIVSGMVESFLRSEPLEAGELTCLSQGTGTIAGQMATVTSQLVMAIEEATGQKLPGAKFGPRGQATAPVSSGPVPISVGSGASAISNQVDSMFHSNPSAGQSAWGGSGQLPAVPTPAVAPAAPAPTPAPEVAHGMNLWYGNRRLEGDGLSPIMLSAPALAIEFSFNMKQVMSLAEHMATKCLKDDAVKSLNLAGEHMQNLEYVSGHFMANGQDVIEELTGAVLSWRKGDAKGFGSNLGLAARKVLLSEISKEGLPEGLPTKEVMANLTAGLVHGLFGEGAALDLKLPSPGGGNEDIHVDLHQCVNDNLQFFQSAWSEVMFFMAKKDAKVIDDKVKMQWGTAVAFTMMQAPGALKKCGVSDDQKQMMEDALETLGSGMNMSEIGVDVTMPAEQPLTKELAATEFAQAAHDWTGKNWYGFGFDIGHMLGQAASNIENKYYIGSDGGLRKRLLGLADARPQAPGSGSLLSLTFLAAVVAMPLVGAAAFRLQKARPSADYRSEPMYLQSEDAEWGGENVAVE